MLQPFRGIAALVAITLLAACGDDPSGPAAVASVRVAGAADSLVVGATMQLSASVRDEGGAELTGRAVAWSSDNPGVARVDSGGAATAVSAGIATISARSEGQVGTVAIRVVPVPVVAPPPVVPPRVSRVVLNRTSLRVVPGQTAQLTAAALDSAGQPVTDLPTTWRSGDSTVATVSSTGLVTVLRGGVVAVSATIGGVVGAVVVEVYATAYVFPDTVNLLVGGSAQITLRSTGDRGRLVDLPGATWESSDPAVARVDSAGRVSVVGNGRATITASLGQLRVASQVYTTSYARPLRFASVTSGRDYACGLGVEGDVYCWGVNQLGAGQPTSRCESIVTDGHGYTYRSTFRCSAIPILVAAGGVRFASVSAGESHACAVSTAGAAYCWGSGFGGALGNGSGADGGAARVSGDITFRSVSAALSFTCGVSTTDDAYCWGGNHAGALGDGTTTSRSVPVRVDGGLKFATLTNDFGHSCGITTTGATYCWGRNVSGELGTGTGPQDSSVPVRVTGNAQFRAVSAGIARTCGLDGAGRAYCWGNQAGSAAGQHSLGPVAVAGDLSFTSINVRDRSCALTADGSTYCWGTSSNIPGRVAPDFPARAYSAGLGVVCVISSEGLTYCRGSRFHGQVGDGVFANGEVGFVRVAGQ
ncbi:MAG TPA: Ig-like domain-containing protein [Longimicrobium sp.]|nr:Ig-like domain-containing protein [Longimicrobium sp.]